MPEAKSVIAALGRVDWDFPGSGTDLGSVHTMHWFPGNFIPQLPSFLIQILSEPGQVVLDPFGGSGTTAIEGMKLGRRMISADSVSACALLARGKVAAALYPLSASVKSHLLSELHGLSNVRLISVVLGEGSDSHLAFGTRSEPYVSCATFGPELRISGSDTGYPGDGFSDLLFACASTAGSLTSTGKIRRHHWGWVADNVRPRLPSTTMQSRDSVPDSSRRRSRRFAPTIRR